MEGTLISCPKCVDKKPILGRVTNDGLLVLRFHHGTTVIRATEYSVACGCGYTIHISHGAIVTSIPILV